MDITSTVVQSTNPFQAVESIPPSKFHMHITRDGFEELLKMLHLTNNCKIPLYLDSTRRFKTKLGKQLVNICSNSARLLTPARRLCIDEMMVKSYGIGVVRQYMPAKRTNMGSNFGPFAVPVAVIHSKSLYLDGSVQSEGGRDVVLELAQPYFDQGFVIYCDRFFSHLDLAEYLRSRSNGLIGTAGTKTLLLDLQHLFNVMHPLTWAYKWSHLKAKVIT